ncbi:T9SS type A sorting domain-containing protein [Fluviicola taffensis]|uniref:Secretion system C-terminal sorting domain-containing protein n=1 Tax=Fluviicola taffensis (strain DSM 16823 / NCIMB 13979 / RW262) TaxID=755732 RepID=F2ICT5_FLUTR|nr:T9SS type A sorting domain-containing protein [Fluviicola taffensis]AEA43309.1 hypothetical protein Fluta_1314 [Fluviicola taffensis DSM 16823]
MNKLLLLGSLSMGLSAYSQTTIFQDDFESGAGNWTLNGGTGQNQWLANNEFIGFTGFIDDTPNQPGTFTGGVNSTYLHITNTSICGSLSVCNANFDIGSASNQSATKTTPIVTTGFTNVTLDFWYLSAGATGISFGIVEYSTDGGTVWTAASGQYSGVLAWTNTTITLPAFNNQTSLKFRFRWQNGGSGDDPAFSIDEVKITGTVATGASLATGAITTTTYCSNVSSALSVPFSVTGTVTAGNVYTAQLSNSTGSFASPTSIGTLTSIATGSLSIAATVPSGLSVGTGYRIRVDASAPATVGTDNGTNISIVAPASISITSVPANGVICTGSSASLTASGGTSYVWSPAGSLNSSTIQNVTATPGATQIYTVVGTDVNSCASNATFTVTVQSCAGLEEESFGDFELYPNPASQFIQLNFGTLKGLQSIVVMDLAGRKVITTSSITDSLDVSTLESGKYFLLIEHGDGIAAKSFLKQ